MFDADQHRIQGHAVNERLSPVDGVQNPTVAGGASLFGQLFAQNAVVGKGPGDAVAKELFGLAIGDCDGGSIPLELNFQIGRLEITERELASFAGGVNGELESVGEESVHADKVSSSSRGCISAAANAAHTPPLFSAVW